MKVKTKIKLSFASTHVFGSHFEPYCLSEISESEKMAVQIFPIGIRNADLVSAVWLSPQRTRIRETRDLLLN